MDYYIAYDDGNTIIRDDDDAPIQRYDKERKEWVTDWNMCGIYSGDIPVKVISKEEAERMISED